MRILDDKDRRDTETEIDTLISTLRWHAMEDLIATRLGTPRPKVPTLTVFEHIETGDASGEAPTETPPEDGLTRFVKGFLRAKRIKLTADEFGRVLNYFRKEMNTPSDGEWGMRWLDWTEAIHNN